MNGQDILIVQKMHAESQAQFDHYNGANDTAKAQFWIGRVTAFKDLLKANGADADPIQVAKAKVDLDNLRKADGVELLKDKESGATAQ